MWDWCVCGGGGGPMTFPGTGTKTESQEEDRLEIEKGWPLAKAPKQSVGSSQPISPAPQQTLEAEELRRAPSTSIPVPTAP